MSDSPQSSRRASQIGLSPGILRSIQYRGVALVILMSILALMLAGCGLLGGGDEEVGEGDEGGNGGQAENPGEVSPDILTKLAVTPTKADNPGEPASESEPTPEPEAPPEPEPTPAPEPTAAPAMVVQVEEDARKLVWVHLSQCISFESTELKATPITGDWFVTGTTESEVKPGLWRVDSVSGDVEPYDVLSRAWASVLESQCSPEQLASLATPTPTPSPTSVVPDATAAVVIVWSFISRCTSDVSTENFEAILNPAQGHWVVATKSDSPTDYGTWTVEAVKGTLAPFAGFSLEWDSVVGLQCNPEALAALSTPTPVPTATPAVEDGTDAVTTLWSDLVKCVPGLPTADLEATWNPATGQWVVITRPDASEDYGVWIVATNGQITPANREAIRRDSQARAGSC